MKKITFLLLAFFTFSAYSQNVVINEIVTSNSTINTDEDGTYQDWVELYNNGPVAINLDGYGLTDNTDLYKWVFPAVTINPGQFLLVYCSDKNRTIVGQPLHTNWKISSDGETISLTAPGNIPVDVIPATVITQNNSYGRFPDGSAAFEFFNAPTPGATNVSTTIPVLNPPIISQASGFYTSAFNLTITADPGATILYTLDGSEPDPNNLAGTTYSYKTTYPENPGDPYGPLLNHTYQTLQYTGTPIAISDRTSQPNKLTGISSTYELNPDYFPAYNVYKGNIVRVRTTKPGFDPSPVITRNYFISPAGNGRFTLPVISLSISEDKLFDYENGIYVAGKLFDDYRSSNPSDVPDYPIGNYTQKGSAFERRANLSYFVNGQEMLNQDVGIRVQGNYSRIYPSKSMNVYSSASYDNDFLDYKFFADRPSTSFKRVVFKNGGSDFFNSFIKDALCAELMENLNTITEASQPAVTFLNGEYWGMLTIREKYDDKFFNRAFGIPESEIELLENDGLQIEEGDNPHYLAMVDYFQNNSLVPQANFDYLKTQMDMDSFSDYFISNIYLNNTDWPGNNIVFWRRNTPYNPNAAYGNDGRWRWAAHDMTATFANPNHNNLAVATSATGTGWPNPQWSTFQLRKLLENPTFKNDFISRFADLMNTTYLSSRVVAMVNELKAEIEPEMLEQMPRWKSPVDLGDWNYFLNLEKTFANNRPAAQRGHIRTQFGIANNINATLNVSNEAHGYVKINTIEIKEGTDGIAANPYPWTGIYFSDIPVKLKAIAKPGYAFSHWTGSSTSTDAEITITTNANFSVTAVFIPEGFAIGTMEPIYFWWFSGAIPNDTPLVALNSSYEIAADATIAFQSAFAGYPFTSTDPNWRKASMERRNKPTPVNYRPEANNNLPYVAGDMKALQITQPFQDGGLENTMVFNMSTVNYKDIKFSFAAMDENAATGISIDYSVNSGAPTWITTGLAATSFPLTTNTFLLCESDFATIIAANNNPDFKIRLRFTGPNMTASAGNRVTFNNMALDGVKLPLIYTTPNVFPIGTAIANLVPTVAASVTSYSISPVLPAGLSFNTTTGVISGTPTEITPTATYTVTAANAGGTATFGIVITITDSAPTLLSYNTPNVFTVSTSVVNLAPTVTGDNLIFSVAPALPAGLTMDTATGVISGTPTVVSVAADYTVTATNSGGNVTFDVVIIVNDIAPFALSYTTPNIYTVGTTISDLIPTITGNVSNYSIVPTMPDGLSFNASTGVISGTPTATSPETPYLITATNSGGSTSFAVFITVIDVAPATLSYNTPNVYVVNTSAVNLTPTFTGLNLAFSVSPNLPAGLNLDGATGVISGTPTAISATTNYTVTATNSGGSVTFVVSITVNDIAPLALSYETPNIYTVNTSVVNLAPTVSASNLTFTVSPSLPLGLVIDATTGIISGTPSTVSATTMYTVTATNSGGSITFDVMITVNDMAPIALSYNTPNVFTANVSLVNLTPVVIGNVTTYSVVPALPAGLSLDASTGIISGTPTTVTPIGSYMVTATNSGGTFSFEVVITVNDFAPLALSYDTPNIYIVNSSIVNLVPTVTGIVVSYSISPSLPSGLTFNTGTGFLSGTPTQLSPATTYTITAMNSGGNVTFDIVITVNEAAPLALSYNTPNVYTTNNAITPLNPTVSGNVDSYSVVPALPDGLSLDTTTGIISGTPTVATAMASYTVTAVNSGGSVSFDVVITVDQELGLANNDASWFSVWPNPFTDHINVTRINSEASYVLFSIDGKLIQQGKLLNSQIGLMELPRGVYLLKISSEERTATRKIIKQ